MEPLFTMPSVGAQQLPTLGEVSPALIVTESSRHKEG